MALDSYSKADLQNMIKAQIIDLICSDRTTTELVQSEDGPFGATLRKNKTKDYNGNVIRVEKWTWNYNAKGNVKTIVHVIRSNDDTADVFRERIEHEGGVKRVVELG